ncbi:MAG: SH3 domain-containing protein [Anaerolineales bacterium]|nr:SH3 domain-containing protein [Anaerolineales bacterium]
MYLKKTIALFMMFCVSCGSVEVESPPTSTPSYVTATLPPTSAPLPTQTLPPPSPIPTNAPIQGTTTTQVNVRAETNTASESLGVISAFSLIQIIGKESTGNWVQVIYENSVGWVRAEFVQVDLSAEIKVVGLASGLPVERSAVVISGINVRSGAGTQFESIGILTQKDVVPITGKSESGAWVQIQFTGKTGWVASEFLQIENIEEVPVIGAVENAPASPAINATPLVLNTIALQDNDSMQVPLAKIILEENKILQITGDVSSPPGDVEDWVEFSAIASTVLIEMDCAGTNLQLEVWQAGNTIENFSSPCKNKTFLNLLPNESYTLRIYHLNAVENSYTSYTLKMQIVR